MDFSSNRNSIVWSGALLMIGAFLYPISERIVEYFSKDSLETTLSDSVAIPFSLEKATRCLAAVTDAIKNVEEESDRTFPLFEDKVVLEIPGESFQQCDELNRLGEIGAGSISTLTVRNSTAKVVENVNIFTSDDVYMIYNSGERNYNIVDASSLKDGWSLGAIPPGSIYQLYVGGHFRSEIFIQSSFGEEVIYAKSLFERWGVLSIFVATIAIPILMLLSIFLPAPKRAKSAESPSDSERSTTHMQYTNIYNGELKLKQSMDLKIRHNLYSDDIEAAIKLIRSEHNLRELESLESDYPIGRTPPGTYYFVYTSALRGANYESFQKNLEFSRVSRFKKNGNSWFEIHYDTDRALYIVGFISESDADRVRSLPGDKQIELVLSPICTEFFKSLVRVPFERVLFSNDRSIQNDPTSTIDVLDLRLQ